MSLGLAPNLSLSSKGAAGGAIVVPQPGGIFDDFSVVNTTLNGKPVQPYGGANWVQDQGTSGGNVLNPQITAAGYLRTNIGSGVTLPAVYVQPGATPTKQWAKYRLNASIAASAASGVPAAMSLLTHFSVVTPNTSYGHARWIFTPAGSGQGSITGWYGNTGPLTTDAASIAGTAINSFTPGSRLGMWGGDTVMIETVNNAGVVTQNVYLNGRMVQLGATDLAAAGVNLTWNAGMMGGAQTTFANLLDDFELVDPNNQAAIYVICGGHTSQRKWWSQTNPLDVYEPVRGVYTQTAPAMIYASVINAATGAVVSGYDKIPLPGFTASGGAFSGGFTILQADCPAAYYVKYERQDVVINGAAAKVFACSPVKNPGWSIGGFGQSLMTQMWQKAGGVTLTTQPPNSWVTDGSVDTAAGLFSGGARDRRVNISTCTTAPSQNANSNPMYMLSVITAAAGHSNFNFIRGGQGGTYQFERQPGFGQGIYEAFQDGIDLAGDIGFIIADPGTYECDGSLPTTGPAPSFNYGADTIAYKGQLDTFLTAVESRVGHPVRMMLSTPPGKSAAETASTIQRTANLARAHWELVKTNGGFGAVTGANPQRYYQGPYNYDLQNNTTDAYHLTTSVAGFPEEARRFGYGLAKVMGYATTDRNGPTIDDTTQPVRAGATLAVTFNLNGATGLELVNTAFASDFRGGMHFYSDAALTTEILPTAVSVGAASAGKATVTWTFASLAGVSYVRSIWGANPFNRTLDATIRANAMIDQSMLRGTFTDPETTFFNPCVQPYFNAAFLTDNTHDFLIST